MIRPLSRSPRAGTRAAFTIVLCLLVLVSVPLASRAEIAGPSDGPTRTLTAEQRIGGFDRYGVASNISRWLPDLDPTHVYIASGEVFADALSVGPVAASTRSRLLLSTRDRIPTQTWDELRRLAPDRITIVGGPGTISESVAAQLAAVAPVDRVGGPDRYAVAAGLSGSEPVDHVVIASGEVFSDALSAGPLAARLNAPLLLTRGGSLPLVTAHALGALRPAAVTVLGGPGTISDVVLAQITHVSGAEVTRIGGANRYEVAANVARAHFPQSSTAVMASGLVFPDGLTGAPLAHALGAPLILSTGQCIPGPSVVALRDLPLGHRIYLGGPSSTTSNPTACGLSALRPGVLPPPSSGLDPPPVPDTGEEAVYLVPHQDDELISMVGGITRDIQQGRRVHVFLLNYGYWTAVHETLCSVELRCLTREQVAASRNAELLTSLEVLGVPASNVHFFYLQEELSGADVAVRDLISRVVSAGGPTVRYRGMSWLDAHPSHFSAAYALRDACTDAGLNTCEYFQSPLYQLRPEGMQVNPVVTPTGVVVRAPAWQVKSAADAYRVDRPDLGRHAIGWRSVSSQITWVETRTSSWVHGTTWRSEADRLSADRWVRENQGGLQPAGTSPYPYEEQG